MLDRILLVKWNLLLLDGCWGAWCGLLALLLLGLSRLSWLLSRLSWLLSRLL